MKFILYLLTFLCHFNISYADFWETVIRVSCIPELDYFTITTHPIERTNDLFQDGYPKDAYRKYGLIADENNHEYTCELPNEMVIKAEFQYYEDPRFSAPHYSCRGSAQEKQRLKLWIAKQEMAKTGEYYLALDEIITWHCDFGMVPTLLTLTYHSKRFIIDWVRTEETHENQVIWFDDLLETNFSN